MMSKLLLFAVVSICILLFTFLYLNRASPKIIETLVIVLITISATIFYISKPEEINKNIHSVIFVDQTDRNKNKLMNFMGVPVLDKFYFLHTITAIDHINKYQNKNSKIGIDYHKNSDLLLELISLLIIEKWRNLFTHHWYVEKETATLAGSDRVTRKYKISNEVENDLIHIPFTDFPKLMINNRYNWKPLGYATHSIDKNGNKTELEDPLHDGGLTFPKNTSFTFATNKVDSPNSYIISLKKPFFYNIKINIQFVAGGVGLANLAEYFECTAPKKNIYSSSINDSNYFRYIIKISCIAKFNRFTSGNPSTKLYKEWANEMFKDIYDNFDWSLIKKAMSQYIVEKASANILLDGKGRIDRAENE